jgi:hypothetical protein
VDLLSLSLSVYMYESLIMGGDKFEMHRSYETWNISSVWKHAIRCVQNRSENVHRTISSSSLALLYCNCMFVAERTQYIRLYYAACQESKVITALSNTRDRSNSHPAVVVLQANLCQDSIILTIRPHYRHYRTVSRKADRSFQHCPFVPKTLPVPKMHVHCWGFL